MFHRHSKKKEIDMFHRQSEKKEIEALKLKLSRAEDKITELEFEIKQKDLALAAEKSKNKPENKPENKSTPAAVSSPMLFPHKKGSGYHTYGLHCEYYGKSQVTKYTETSSFESECWMRGLAQL